MTIQAGIPIPPKRRRGRSGRWPLLELEPGVSICIEEEEDEFRARRAVESANYNHRDKGFEWRFGHDDHGIARIWRVK